VREALVFSVAVVLVELLCVRISLTLSKKVSLGNKYLLLLMPMAILLLVYLGVSSFISYSDMGAASLSRPSLPLIKSSFLLGLVLSLSNPLHIPFWMTWNSILKQKNKLDTLPGMYTFYILGIGLGSIGGLLVFIYAGAFIFNQYQQYAPVIPLVMGCLYILFSCYLMFLFYRNSAGLKFKIKK
jgi:threonine/homoserine/homoserine lactone efflux protein